MSTALPARAAGGHFDVDDAAVLEPGQCQLEAWALRAPAAPLTLLHLGPACRAGAVELGVNVDRIDAGGAGARTLVGPQAKWVAALQPDTLAAGAVWAVAFDTRRGGRPLHTAYVPLTWTPTPTFAVNFNAGADWDAVGDRTRRLGVSGEWAAGAALTFIAERVTIGGGWLSRVGGRVALGASTSLDISVAQLGPTATRVWAIGLNQAFAR